MIEKIIYDYLNGVDGAPPALMEIPAERQAPPFFVIQKTAGGQIEGVVGEATLAIQSFGTTLYEAAQTNELLKTLMAGAAELNEIAAVRLNSDYNFTDTTKRQYRYQAVYQIVHY